MATSPGLPHLLRVCLSLRSCPLPRGLSLRSRPPALTRPPLGPVQKKIMIIICCVILGIVIASTFGGIFG